MIDWLTDESDEYVRDHVGNMTGYSRMIETECEKLGQPCFDISEDFLGANEAATDFLFGASN
jgi:hypothetical protein